MSIIISAIIVVASGGSALGIFLAGAASGGIMTGTWQGAFKGGLFALFSAGIAQGVGDAFFNSFGLEHGATLFSSTKVGAQALRAVAHGLSRGVISMAQGGTFKSGFASGFASSFFSPGTQLGGEGAGGFTLRTTIAGVVGGTASEIGGGKFSNGAISGAFVHMFNAENVLMGKGTDWSKYEPTKEVSNYSGFKYLTDKSAWVDGLKNVRTASVIGTYGSAIALQPEGVVFFTATRLTSDYMITQLGGQDSMAIYRHSFIDVATSIFPTTSVVPAALLLRVYTKNTGDAYAN